MTVHKRARREEEEDASGTTHHHLPPTPTPSSSSHPSLPRKPLFVTPLSPRKSNQYRVITHQHTLPPRPSTSVQAASVKSYPLPNKPAISAESITPPSKTHLLPTSLPPTPPATPAPTAADGDTIGKINDIPTLLMILRTREQYKPMPYAEQGPLDAVYPQYSNLDCDETPTKKRKYGC